MKMKLALILAVGMSFLCACSQNSQNKTINVLDKGVVAEEGVDNSAALQRIFSSAPKGSTIYFPEGIYEFDTTIYLMNKKNISIVGDNAVLVRSGLDNITKVEDERTAAFIFYGCEDVSVKGLTVKHSGRANVSGEITKVDTLLGTVTIKPYDDIKVSGKELFHCINTFDQEGVPDKKIEHYSTESPFIIVPTNENEEFVLLGIPEEQLKVAEVGDRVCVRSLTAEYLFVINNTKNTLFEDVTITNAYDGGFLIGPHSENATFIRLKILPENENCLMSINSDGIHASGLGGELIFEDCYFYGLGDDCLNVHTTPGIVEEMTSNTISFSSKYGYTDWAKNGDLIEFYDTETFLSLGTTTLKKISNNELTFDSIPEGVKKGTILSNKTLHPSVKITDTTVRSNRARAFLLQTENVVVENCDIYGTSLSAILISSDIVYWKEVCPGKNITIRNNTFENCANYAKGVVQITTSHDSVYSRYGAGVTENITVESNIFKNCNASAVFAASTSDLTVKDNKFDGDYTRFDAVYVVNSDNITVIENRFMTPNGNLFGGENYNNVILE